MTDAVAPPVVIPAYQPEPQLVAIVDDLLSDPGLHAIVVDDGSSASHAAIFAALAQRPRVHLLRHAVNLGKGQALKTAFNYFLVTFPAECPGVVTADADGQHLADDIRRVAASLSARPLDLTLGSRQLGGAIPWKSAIGNAMTRRVFRGFVGRSLVDTQTGLRGIPRRLLPDLLPMAAAGYEFELEMLVMAANRRMIIHELPIATVYEANNRTTHFNPLIDSLKIYFVFLRFVALSLVTVALDFLTFSMVYRAGADILISTIAARIVAGTFNFYFARTVVFRSHAATLPQALKYTALVVWLMGLSYLLLTTIVELTGIPVFAAKAIAETTLFVASFAVQRVLVFGAPESSAPTAAATDWNAYYARPIGQAAITRRITQRLLLQLMQRHGPAAVTSICELGGANSCFYDAIRSKYPEARYSAIDNNTYGLTLLKARHPDSPLLHTSNADVRNLADEAAQSDIVFSVGLIEHFAPEDTARIIDKHFMLARPGGIVIITFPTPTWLYRVTRMVAEQLGLWRFPDERPLTFDEVAGEASRLGTIVERLVNWPIVLTQGVIVVRR
jgi:putative flippase GtrA